MTDSGQQWQAEQAASVAALQAGALPLRAQQRIDDLLQRESSFTSDLSINEFLLTRQQGFRPVAQVTGTALYHIGGYSIPGTNAAIPELCQWNEARSLALSRLQQEAHRLGAHAVAAVRFMTKAHDWAPNCREYTMLGTALRLEGTPPVDKPAISLLSGQDFWKLYQSGYWPAGVVAHTTYYYVHSGARRFFSGSFSNQELQDSSAGMYQAKHETMQQIEQQTQALGAIGAVGMLVEQGAYRIEVELLSDQVRYDLLCWFYARGTAITEVTGAGRQAAPPRIFSALSLKR